MKAKKIILIIIAIIMVLSIIFAMFKSGNNNKKDSNKIQVVVSNFASYDFLRAVIGQNENIELSFLMGPGKEAHSYEPTAQNLISIQNSDLFVYIGGEMEKWSDKVLDSIDTTHSKVICIADFVETIKEQEIDGAEAEDEEEEEEGSFDEHIWTSPANAIKMVEVLEQAIEEIDSKNSEIYKKNSENYIAQIKNLDKQMQEIMNNKVRNRLIFGDKMPMQYFINYYNLKVSAAFSGCSTETEPSAATIAYLVNKAKEEKIPVILYIELNTDKVAKTIADEVGNGCKAMQIQSLHNVSLNDFNAGETYITLMNRNMEVLKKALQ